MRASEAQVSENRHCQEQKRKANQARNDVGKLKKGGGRKQGKDEPECNQIQPFEELSLRKKGHRCHPRSKRSQYRQSISSLNRVVHMCLKKNIERGSPESTARRRPSANTRFVAPDPQTPKVSIATRMKMCEWLRSAYLQILRLSADDAAAPAVKIVLCRCDGASVSGQVKSQIMERPPDQGMRVEPSDLIPSPPNKTLRLRNSRNANAPECTSNEIIDSMIGDRHFVCMTCRDVRPEELMNHRCRCELTRHWSPDEAQPTF